MELIELLNVLLSSQLILNPASLYSHADVKCFLPHYAWHILVAAAVRNVSREPGACLFIDI